jgi:citrate synthase
METKGLESIIAAQSQLSFIDGQAGRLIYRGYDIHDLARYSTYEEVVYLLWQGELPNRRQLDEFSRELAAHRELPDGVVAVLRALPKTTHPMDGLRTAVSALSGFDPDTEDNSREATLRKATRLTAQMASIAAIFERVRSGKAIVAPQYDLSHAANFLYMLRGTLPDAEDARALDTYFILLADHELNASTFTARTIVSTESDLHAAITGAIGALKGALHGGANQKVMEMLLEIGTAANAEPYVTEAMTAKKKLMGFGHRVYKTEDPRAVHLRRMSKELGEKYNAPEWYEMSKIIEDLVIAKLGARGINTNVEFYSASVLYLLGIPFDLFTPLFACSRIAGWSAHVLEQLGDNRLIRPKSEYLGKKDLPYVPIDQRAS